jgi:[acyl-carrier-protein] S-malonyltransferase
MKKIFVFPGQGSQMVRMGQDIYDQHYTAKAIFDKGNDALKKNLTKIMFQGDMQKLSLTENAQPALMLHSMALLSVILKEKPIEELCSYVAGHSVGEYSALCANGTIDLLTTMRLLDFRGKFMQESCDNKAGSMAACLKINKDTLEKILTEISDNGICGIANDNSDGQIVISGHNDLVIKAIEKVKQIGGNAILLNVNGAFHSDLMQDAQEKMHRELDKINFANPKVPIVMNISASAEHIPEQIKKNLQRQITAPVKWRQIILFAMERELEVVEIGPGQVLSNLAKRANYPFKITTINNLESLDNFISNV